MVSTPYSLTDSWTNVNSYMAEVDCEALLSNASAHDIRWARSADGGMPEVPPTRAHLLRPGANHSIPLTDGEILWMAGSPFGQSVIDVFERILPIDGRWSLANRAALADLVTAGTTRPDGETVVADGLVYKWNSETTAISDMPGVEPEGEVSPRHFGAVPGGETPCGAALQAWLDYLCANPCKIGLLDGVYLCDADLLITDAVHIRGFTWGSDTASASGPGDPPSALIADNGVTDLLTVRSDTPGNRIYSVHLEGFALRGDNRAERGLVMVSTYYARISLWTDRFKAVGVEFTDAEVGLSAFNMIEFLRYNAGSNMNCYKSIGLKIDGISGHGTTQFVGGQINCDIQTVSIVSVADDGTGTAVFTTDEDHHCQIGDKVMVYNHAIYRSEWGTVSAVPSANSLVVDGVAYVSSNGGRGRISAGVGAWIGDLDSSWFSRFQGDSIYFAGDRTTETPSRRSARKVTFGHVGAKIIMGSGSLITMGNINSEPSSLTVHGKATLNTNIVDRKTGAHFKTETYRMSEQYPLGLKAAHLEGLVSEGIIDSRVPRLQFNANNTGKLYWQFAMPRTWNDGLLKELTLDILGTAGTGDALFEIEVSIRAEGEALVGAANLTVQQAVQHTGVRQRVVVPLDLEVEKGGLVSIGVSRLSDNEADTLAQHTNVLTASVAFVGNGPSDSNDIWDVPSLEVI